MIISRRATCGLLAAALTLVGTPALANDQRTEAPEGAKVYFIAPADGATVSSPVTVKFGLSGMGVAPAGVERDGTGHHHLLINQKLEDYAQPIPADDNHRHFGGGQTEANIELPAGTHTLQLVVGDHNHVPHAPPIESATITITVK
ncbi:MAG: DUF4399 domain-containing protein [Pseudomonadota bacterium]